jgi:hypothetical protein
MRMRPKRAQVIITRWLRLVSRGGAKLAVAWRSDVQKSPPARCATAEVAQNVGVSLCLCGPGNAVSVNSGRREVGRRLLVWGWLWLWLPPGRVARVAWLAGGTGVATATIAWLAGGTGVASVAWLAGGTGVASVAWLAGGTGVASVAWLAGGTGVASVAWLAGGTGVATIASLPLGTRVATRLAL